MLLFVGAFFARFRERPVYFMIASSCFEEAACSGFELLTCLAIEVQKWFASSLCCNVAAASSRTGDITTTVLGLLARAGPPANRLNLVFMVHLSLGP